MTKISDKMLAQYRCEMSEKLFVATLECAAGNGEVGSMWLETAVFGSAATLTEVMAWAKLRGHGNQGCGRLILTVAEQGDKAPG